MEEIKENIKSGIQKSSEYMIEGAKELTKIDDKNWFNNLPLLLFVAMLGIVHVANNHYLENKVRRINKIEAEIKELRWNYMTSKSNLMLKSKQSEIAKEVEKIGLKELTVPPYKIEVKKDDY